MVRRYSGIGLVVCLYLVVGAGPLLAADPGPGNANEWDTYTAISVDITSHVDGNRTGSPLAHYVLVGETVTLTASAADADKYRCTVGAGGDGVWYDYADDVTSGNLAADYHMKWFTTGNGSYTDRYGTTASYGAGPYTVGDNVRSVTITVEADDFDRNGDTDNTSDNDEAKDSHTVVLKVWQLAVEENQANDNDCALVTPVTNGGSNPGDWCVPNTPAGCTTYTWNQEMKGTIPAGPSTAGITFTWLQKRKGTYTGVQNTVTKNILTPIADGNPDVWANELDDSPYPEWQQTTPVNRKIFFVDTPGFRAGAANNAAIANGWTERDRQRDYRCYVEVGGRVVSNKMEWLPYWKINVVPPDTGTTWSVTSALCTWVYNW